MGLRLISVIPRHERGLCLPLACAAHCDFEVIEGSWKALIDLINEKEDDLDALTDRCTPHGIQIVLW